MDTLTPNSSRELAVAVLALSASELGNMSRIHRGHDDAASKIDSQARQEVGKLRDRYADGGTSPLAPLAAQEMRELSDALERRAKTCGNVHAAADLQHESNRLTYFIMTTGVDVDGDGHFVFTS